MLQKIKSLSEKYSSEIIKIRHHLHENPELSFCEVKTSEYIIETLKKLNIQKISKIAGTGVVALIEGKNPEYKVIALRADIDALPIVEKNDIAYKSKNSGVMHACGHDVHTSTLLGVAKILSELKDEFEGTVKLIFQPAEEKLPGGAIKMIEEGVLTNPIPEIIIAQHVDPALPIGTLGFKSGMYMASTDEVYLTVRGKGGHAAMPHEINDTVLSAAQIITALQQVVSRKAKAGIPSVLSFGKIIGNGATNIIPEEVKIEGTFRTMNEAWRKEALTLIQHIAETTAQAMGTTCEVFIMNGYPALINDENLTEKAKKIASEFVGKENVKDLEIRMTAEDFSYFTNSKPGILYRLGVRNEEKGIINPLHSPSFNIDEKALEIGVGYMAFLAVSLLK